MEKEKRLTRSQTDVVQSQLSNSGVQLEQQRERLANATGGAEDGHLGELRTVRHYVSIE